MPNIDLKNLHQSLQKKKWNSRYLFLGEETWIADRGLQLLKNAIVNPELADFNYNVISVSDCDWDSVLDEIESLPVMSSHRLVVLREGHLISEKMWEAFHGRWSETSSPHKTVLLVLAHSGDKRKKFFKKYCDMADILDCKPPYENQRAGWLRTLAVEEKLQISDEAISYWERQGGFSLSEAYQDLKKIRTFLYREGVSETDTIKVELSDVQKLLPRFAEDNLFKFTELIGQRDFVKAREVLEKLLDQGESEIGMVQLLARHGRLLLKVQQGLHQNLKGGALAAFVGVSGFFIQEYHKQALLWSHKSLQQLLVLLQNLDRQLKSSGFSPKIHWENFILDLQCAPSTKVLKG